MMTRKHNEYLEAHLSSHDDASDDRGYDSEAVVERKGGGRVASRRETGRVKRRRIGDDLSGEEGSGGSGDDDEEEQKKGNEEEEEDSAGDEDEYDEENHTGPNGPSQPNALSPTPSTTTSKPKPKPTNPHLKPLTPAALAASHRALLRTGVIYLSRIPPFMKPLKLRSLLTPFGPLGRIFLTPEPASSHTLRVRHGGNKKPNFLDGWVEFHSKTDAKRCVQTLNTRIVGGKKGGWYYDDVWNLKYLRGFKWPDLTEQLRVERVAREGRMRVEVGRARREDEGFVRGVESSKVERTKREREIARRRPKEGLKTGVEGEQAIPTPEEGPRVRRHFRQNKVHVKTAPIEHGSSSAPTATGENPKEAESVRRVLSKIF
ncbi:MAG: RNA-binding ATPase activator esf2 [Caeruleum heppii]|nr:MAG: RNA-binding ATPase activator esf2 [Caeruleum heppii]